MSKLYTLAVILIFPFCCLVSADTPVRPEFLVVLKQPLKLESVTSESVCGSIAGTPNSRTCVGAKNAETAMYDSVSKLEHFILAGGQLCGTDERGVRCWGGEGKYEKPIREILASGDPKMVRSAGRRICMSQPDEKTIFCVNPEHQVWTEGSDPELHPSQWVMTMPPREVYGPYADLRDFQVTEQSICVIDGEKVHCERYKDQNDADPEFNVPTQNFPGARKVTMTYSSICVLYDAGLYCSSGRPNSFLMTYNVGSPWKGATDLFKSGFETICGTDKDGKPLCSKLGVVEDEIVDATPEELTAPNIRVLKFKTFADSRCALVEDVNTNARTLLCTLYQKLEPVPGLTDVVDFEVANESVCALSKNGFVDCFYGSVRLEAPLPDDGTPVNRAGVCRWNKSRFYCSTTATTIDISDIKNVISYALNSEQQRLPCFIYEDQQGFRKLKCMDSPDRFSQNVSQIDPTNDKLVSNSSYACAYGGDSATCWGSPLGGVAAPNLSLAKKVLFGSNFGCGADQFGFICWGSDLPERELELPSGVGDLDSVVDFAVGDSHVCAINRDKRVLCWGSDTYGQLKSPQLTNPTSIVASGNTTCASSDEGVSCWGVLDEDLMKAGSNRP